MAAKALLCKIKIDVWRKKKKQWVKNDLSVSSHLQQYRRWPHHSLCSGREWAPRLSQRLGLKVSMDLWTYPMIIPQAVSYVCACVCVFGGVFLHEKDRAKHAEWWEGWEVKSLQDWKAQIIRSACRSSVLKSIYTIHALGCQVHAALCCPRTSSFKISIIKECTLSGN